MRRIRLGNGAFEGQNAVYLLEGDATALVDTGVATDDARRDLRDGLAEAGLSFADVDEVLLTHWHPDHAGLAGEIQRAGDATVRIHRADAPLVAGDADAVEREAGLVESRLDQWGLPPDAKAGLLAFRDDHRHLRGDAAEVTPFSGGDALALGDRSFEVVHLPGHAAGLCAFVPDAPVTEGGEGDASTGRGATRGAFVGDAILPKYTPNVGGADVRVDDPLATYAGSLARVVERDWDRAWPGHRDPIDDPAGRARDVLDHHRERTERVVRALREGGPADAWTVSARLFGDLSGVHVLHGPGEAFAHLDHLASAGVVDRDEGAADGGDRYALIEADPDLDSLFPSVDAA